MKHLKAEPFGRLQLLESVALVLGETAVFPRPSRGPVVKDLQGNKLNGPECELVRLEEKVRIQVVGDGTRRGRGSSWEKTRGCATK